MKLDDLLAMPAINESDEKLLAPSERRREIAMLLAAGVLRLLSRNGSLPESTIGETGSVQQEISDFSQKRLDVLPTKRTHVHVG